MKPNFNIFLLTLALLNVFFSTTTFADSTETMIVSVNKVIPVTQVQEYVSRLERLDPTTGTCSFSVTITAYIPYDWAADIPYYGVALVEISEICSEKAKNAYLAWLNAEQDQGVYTVYANGPIGPTPVVGGRN